MEVGEIAKCLELCLCCYSNGQDLVNTTGTVAAAEASTRLEAI